MSTQMAFHSRRGQEMLLVLYALAELGGIRRRQEVVDHISGQRWYELIGEDLTPTRTSREACYRIDLAWARKDGVLRESINNFERDSWELNRHGREVMDEVTGNFRSGHWDISRCEFFTAKFKRLIVPAYEAKPTDRKRISSAEDLAREYLL
ncbi:MAG TPA: hypothetical protein VK717_13540 [Opitutaceae bacterium]|jgi:hypothetical protein|nr:hypothetical protein [Opitutaceae bacterium]